MRDFITKEQIKQPMKNSETDLTWASFVNKSIEVNFSLNGVAYTFIHLLMD